MPVSAHPDTPVLIFVVNVSWFFLSHRLPLALEAMRRGYRVHLLTEVASDTDRETLETLGIVVHPMVIERGKASFFSDLRAVILMIRVFREIRPDLVHLVTIKPILFGAIVARALRVQGVVAAVPGLGYAFMSKGLWASFRWLMLRAWYRVSLSYSRCRVVFQNVDDLKVFVSAGLVDADRAVLIRGAGVNVEEYSESAERDGTARIVLASRMLFEKGVVEFTQAATLLRERGVSVTMQLVGGLDPANPGAIPELELRRLCAASGVDWLGHRSDMAEVLAGSHVVCLPTYGEGLPKVLIEAAATGRAIVATDVPGCREIVIDGETGLLVPPRDAVRLANAIQRLADDPPLRRRLGHRGRELVEREFSLGHVVSRIFQLYESLLPARSRPQDAGPGGRPAQNADR